MTRTTLGNGTPTSFLSGQATMPVLVVDDFSNMRSTLRQMLLSAGYEDIDMAATGEDAVEKLGQRRYEIVLCDYNLGEGLDGQQVLDLARDRGLIDLSTLFIMVTAETTSDMVMGAVESIPDGYLSKPFTKDLLAVRLARGIRRKQPLKALDPLLRRGELKAAMAAAGRMLEVGEGQASDLLRLRAHWAVRTGATAVVQEAAATAWDHSRAAWAGTLLADLEAGSGDAGAAEARYREVIRETPQFMPAHDRLCDLLRQTGRCGEALELLKAAAERSPRSLERQRLLGRLAMEQGEPETALQAWRRVIRIGRQMGQEHPSDHAGRIAAMIATGARRQARQAVRDLDASFARHPDQAWYSVLARLQLAAGGAAGELEDALARLETLPMESMPEDIRQPLNQALETLGQR